MISGIIRVVAPMRTSTALHMRAHGRADKLYIEHKGQVGDQHVELDTANSSSYDLSSAASYIASHPCLDIKVKG